MGQLDSNERANKREKRYEESQDNIRLMRKELDRNLKANGDVLNALKGDGLGNPGMISRVETLEEKFSELKDTMDDLLVKTNKKQTQLNVIIGMGGVFVGIFIKWVFEQIQLSHVIH